MEVNHKAIIRVVKGPRTGDTFEQRSGQSDDLAIVERLIDLDTESTVFIAAGLGVVGTRGAVHYIVNNWHRLAKEFDKKPFAICLRFQDTITDHNAYIRPIEVARLL